MHRLVERAQSMGGTCTGEHGIGQGKQKYLKTEIGPEAIDAMRAIKQALDPQNIFNPGKDHAGGLRHDRGRFCQRSCLNNDLKRDGDGYPEPCRLKRRQLASIQS